MLIKNGSHPPQDLWSKIYSVVVLLVYHDIFHVVVVVFKK